eukprot:TRINITY_DN25790_c0_g1_i1.p2 TRINITY_DN25790_c0_g1~~TRINITY_DN25790_c0_g1_i1.p2  ORF type:complete len:237 (+),score=86.97 TRINITY_DN25790_c0_g1_i1:107-817(+)
MARDEKSTVGYSPMWLNRPVAETARMDVFKMATGEGRDGDAYVGKPTAGSPKAQSMVKVDLNYKPWLARIPGCCERLNIQQMHNASIRAFRQRKIFNMINRTQPMDVSHTVARRQGGASCRYDGNMSMAAQAGGGIRLPKITAGAPNLPALGPVGDASRPGPLPPAGRGPKMPGACPAIKLSGRPKDDVSADEPMKPRGAKPMKPPTQLADPGKHRLAPLFSPGKHLRSTSFVVKA